MHIGSCTGKMSIENLSSLNLSRRLMLMGNPLPLKSLNMTALGSSAAFLIEWPEARKKGLAIQRENGHYPAL